MCIRTEKAVMGSGSSRSSSLKKVCSDHCGGINWLSLSPDGSYLLTASEDGTARLWKTSEQKSCMHFQGHESYITHCHLENDVAYTCSADQTIRKWDVATGCCTVVFRGHTSIVNKLLVTRSCLFSGSYDRTARCWSLDTGRQLQEFRGHWNGVLALDHFYSQDFLPELDSEQNKEFLITGSTDCTVKLWLVPSGRCYQTLRGHKGAILCMALDIPNRALFTGSRDYTVRRWDLTTGEQTKVFQEHQGSVICLELANRHLYSGSADQTVKCWKSESGKCIRTYKAHKHTVSTMKYHNGILPFTMVCHRVLYGMISHLTILDLSCTVLNLGHECLQEVVTHVPEPLILNLGS
ncbi:WD repeat-containing protein 86 isoform X2 [Lepisosteus oculatus]|uniref:WD repeat-containing protein 86 isoform X2 n=1 Tax=Lepisosteus oculatus TaxID=7918 RepID=UPI00073FC41F|nr:PREDICTED: WD repeat-containing protein 86 isoform X2 [Lepisosteus oculatus]